MGTPSRRWRYRAPHEWLASGCLPERATYVLNSPFDKAPPGVRPHATYAPNVGQPRPMAEISMMLLSLDRGASHGRGQERRRVRSAAEQGQTARPEAPTEAEGDLGHSHSTAAGPSNPRTRPLQPRHRQQAARPRPGRAARARRRPREPSRAPGDRHAEEDPAAGSV